MKSRIGILMITIIICFAIILCASCSTKNVLEYDMNLGYDFNSVTNKNFVFNIYHSNSFSSSPS